MLIDPQQISKRTLYAHMTRLIVPRPIAWVSTRSREGIDNLAPFSYFNAVGTAPPTLMFCPANRGDGTKKDTLANIEATGQFVVNLVPCELGQAMSDTSAELAPEVNEFSHCGLTAIDSQSVNVPRVAEAPAAFECELHTVLVLGTGPGGANLVVGRIVAIHIDERVIDQEGLVDPELLDALGRMGGDQYATTRDRLEIARPTRT